MKIQVQIENKNYEVEIEDLNARPILAKVNGETVEVMPEAGNISAAPVAAAKPVASVPSPAAPQPVSTPAPAAGANVVVAPIPGVIEDIKSSRR